MNRILLSILLSILTSTLFGQSITIDTLGIVRCKNVPIGTTETIGDNTYEVVDRDILIQRRNEGADLTKVCVSNITDMSQIFQNRSFNQPIGNWDVSSVTTMKFMFDGSNFNQSIENWDVSSVTDMSFMFSGKINSTNSPPRYLRTPFNQPIGNWDVSSVTNMDGMFALSEFNQSIENWDVSSVTIMRSLFSISLFDQPIGNWDVSSVTNMNSMFLVSKFNQPIGDWDVSAVENMYSMFLYSPYNHPLETWDVRSVTDFRGMFQDSDFNQPINKWCVVNHPTEPDNFADGSSISTQNKPVWGTCPEGTSIELDDMPTKIILYQNYPNPFNPSTQIRFTLVSPTFVKLEVYSITGQLISTLMNETMSGGLHTIPFDGESLSSGVYIYRLTTAESSQSRLMQLIK